MTRIGVEKGVRLPPMQRVPREWKYPWSQMEIGDSFYVDDVNMNIIKSATSARARKYYEEYAIRPQGKGFRVWRTA